MAAGLPSATRHVALLSVAEWSEFGYSELCTFLHASHPGCSASVRVPAQDEYFLGITSLFICAYILLY